MSRSLMLKMSGLMFFGALAGAVGMSFLQPEKTVLRGTASLGGPQKPTSIMGKHLSVIQVALEAPNGIPDREDQDVTLVGSVRMNKTFDQDLQYHWELPAGVQVVSGHVDDSLSGVKAGDDVKVELTVTGFSKENFHLVGFSSFVELGESKLGNSAVLTSRPEDSYEMLAVASGINASQTKRPLLKGKLIR